MTKLTPTSPKLFGALGPDDSYFDTKTKAAARDAQQRWPLFKTMPPQSADSTPVLTSEERSRWTQVEAAPQEAPKMVLSRPGLGSKLATGLGKIARQTTAEAASSNDRQQPRAEVTRAFAPPPPPARVYSHTPEPIPEFPKPQRLIQRDEVVAEVAPPPPETVVLKSRKPTKSLPKAAEAADDSLSSIFQRVQGDVKPPEPIAVVRKGAMKRLGKR